jgi:hypothetical protein
VSGGGRVDYWASDVVESTCGRASPTTSIREMPAQLLTVTFDAHDPDRLAAFWAGVLERVIVPDSRGVVLPGPSTQVGLRFAASGSEKVGPNRVHLHLTSTSVAGQRNTVDAALELGAVQLDVGQLPDEDHVVLADPEGNEFCVIEPDSSFLAGCGFLGELACDGTREVGVFWAQALGWRLVWDQDQETAVQSPHGGTKVAWGGPPVKPRNGRNRQRFDLTFSDGDLAAEVVRLVALGATRLTDVGGAVELADSGGNEFDVSHE